MAEPHAPTHTPTTARTPQEQEFRRRVSQAFEQLTKGCGYPNCTNPQCASSRSFSFAGKNESSSLAAAALRMASLQTPPFCQRPSYAPPLQMAELVSLVAAARDPALGVDADAAIRPLVHRVGAVFGSLQSLRLSFLPSASGSPLDSFAMADLDLARDAFALLDTVRGGGPNGVCLGDVVAGSLVRSVNELNANRRLANEKETLRFVAIAFEFPRMTDPSSQDDLLGPLAVAVASMPKELRDRLSAMWAASFVSARMRDAAMTLETAISTRIITHEGMDVARDRFIPSFTGFLDVLHRANSLLPESTAVAISFREWYNTVLSEAIDVRDDFINWKKGKFSFCRFPFLLEVPYKVKVLQIESMVEQRHQAEQSMGGLMFGGIFFGTGGPPPFLPLKVRRDRLLADSLSELERHEPAEYKKELRVKFAGEDGLDYGGVQREWFKLVVQAVFDPMFGMFVLNKANRTFWFNMNSDSFSDFKLVGMLLGLAIYNSAILDLRFPLVVYKKLKGIKPTLDDLRDTYPDVHQGLTRLLEMNGDVSEIGETFEVHYERYGAVMAHELKPGGASIPVTNENREEYVRLRVQHLLEDSVAQQFGKFAEGFRLLCNSEGFDLFAAEELELVICGNPVLDWKQLQAGARYDGYDESHPIIVAFWEFFHSLSEDLKKQFLTFTTGSDRCPVGGLAELHLIISRHGPDTDSLPTASTCFNHLHLPQYSSRKKMEAKLLQAIQNSTGFGLV